jgi:hypothetical protein
MRLFALLVFGLAACSHVVNKHVCFPDQTCLDSITYESNPSILNSALITHVKLVGSKTVETTVQGGTSPGKAMVDSFSAVAGAGAFAGTATAVK